MAGGYADAVRKGVMAAERLHRQLDWHRMPVRGGSIDVFAAFVKLNLPLLLRPLKGLLGAYFREPTDGVLVTTRRPLAVQRFTAAHELGHYYIKHSPSLDDEGIILGRSPFDSRGLGDSKEIEANAFAAAFLMPRWLIAGHREAQGWKGHDYSKPEVVYQLALRLGTSFSATCWTLLRYRLITVETARQLNSTRLRDIKAHALGQFRPSDFRRDVWVLTERDAGTFINGSRHDLFVLRLCEHSSGGYVWSIDELRNSGFAIVDDVSQDVSAETIGSNTIRCITAMLRRPQGGQLDLSERRPWQPTEAFNHLVLDYDLTGPEGEGLSRAERHELLDTAA